MEHYEQDQGKNTAVIELIILRFAQENIPIRVMSRVLGCPEPKLKRVLLQAYEDRKIEDMPPEDWPHLGGISRKLPSSEMIRLGHPDRDVADVRQVFGLDTGEACVLMCLVKRAGQFCSNDMLIQATAMDPDKISSNLVRVRVHRLRKQTLPMGVHIVTKQWFGYMMPPKAAQIVIDKIAAYRREIIGEAA